MTNFTLCDPLYVASCFDERYRFYYYTRRTSSTKGKYCLRLVIYGLDHLLFEERYWFFDDKASRKKFMCEKIAIYNNQHIQLIDEDLR